MKKNARANRPGWDHGQKTVTTPGTAEQLDALAIPDGFELVVRALQGNDGNIFLGNSQANAQDANKRLTFTPGNGPTLRVRNANQVWVDAAQAGEGVDYWTEV